MTSPRIPGRAGAALLSVLAGIGGVAARPEARSDGFDRSPTAAPANVRAVRTALPLRFEPGADGGFLARCRNYRLLLREGEAVFALQRPSTSVALGSWNGRGRRPARTEDGAVIRMRFGGGAAGEGFGRLPGVSHYLVGSDTSRWRTGVPAWSGVTYRGVRSGVDLVFRGNPRDLQYDLRVAPGGDPGAVELVFEGASSAEVDAAGRLVLRTPDGCLLHGAPVAWQEGTGGERVPVAARWRLREGGRASFEIGPHDRTRPLVVDPAVSYATYLGGGDLDTIWTTAVDGAGSMYIAGWSRSSNFPVTGAYQGSNAGGIDDAFVAKFTADGSTLAYSTYLGGNGFDEAFGLHVPGDGSLVLAGITSSTNFPTVSPLQAVLGGGTHDAFLARIAPGGASLSYSTYLGGSGFDDLWSLKVDSQGVFHISGASSSTNLPLVAPSQASFGGGSFDAFVARISSSGTSLAYSSYIGGTGNETAASISVDSAGNSYFGGWTSSTNFPTTNAIQGSSGGGTGDGYFCAVGPSGGTLIYSTYIGGSGFDDCTVCAVDASGTATYAGFTSSPNFPVVAPFQASNAGGGDDAYVIRLNSAGSTIHYSSYLGGGGFDQPYALVVDAAGAAYVAGFTYSTDFPLQRPLQSAHGGGLDDGFVAKVAPAGNSLEFSTYLGGNGFDEVFALALGAQGGFTAAGITSSSDFPVQSPYQSSPAGGSSDSFLVQFVLVPPAAPSGLTAQAVGISPVRLAWTDNSADETGFEIQRRTAAGTFANLAVAAADAESFDDVQTAPKSTYTYRIRSVSVEGASPWSNEASATTPYLPSPPTGLTATAVSTSGIDLAWTDASDNETGFEVSRRTEIGGFTNLASVAGGATAYQDRGLLPDRVYTYRVRSIGAVGISAFAPDASALTDSSISIMLAKGAVKDGAKPGKDKASLSCNLSVLPGAPDPVFDPRADGLTLLVGGESMPLTIGIPSGDEGWVEKNGRLTWKSPRKTTPKVVLTWTPEAGLLTAKVSKAEFPSAPVNPIRLSVRGGNDGGSLRGPWTEKKPGSLAYP